MTIRGTLVLWTMVLALGLYVVFGERQRSDRNAVRRSESESTQALLQFDTRQVDAINLTDAEGEIHLRRDATGWRDQDAQLRIAPGQVTDFLHALATLRPLRSIAQGSDQLTTYGLDPPRRRVTLEIQETAGSLVLALGDHNPPSTAVYATLGSAPDRVVLVGAVILWEIEKITRGVRRTPTVPRD